VSNEDRPLAGDVPGSAAAGELGRSDVDDLRVFKSLADNAFFGNVICDSDGVFRYVNRYFAELHGYTPEEMIGQPISLVHTPEQVAVSQEIMATAVRDGRAEPQEHRFLHRDGTTFPLLVGVLSVKASSGDGVYVAMSAVDVSAARRAEGAYQTLFTEMLDGLAHHRIICDDAGAPVDYRFLAVNPAFEMMTGLRATDIIGRTVLEVLPGTEQSWIDTYGKVALTGESTRFEDYAATLDKYFEVTAFCPAPGEFATIFQDVTDRRRTEQALRRREVELNRTQRLAHLGSWTWNAATDEVAWTETLYALFGLDPSLATPTLAQQSAIFSPPSYEALVAAVAKTFETGDPYEMEVEIVRADGEVGWAWVHGERLTDDAGSPVGLWGAAQDITDRKAREAERLRLEADLAQALRLESVGRLAGSVAHDFNNMLTVILGHAERILEEAPPDAPSRAGVEEIRQAADRSAALTRQLLAFARNQPASPTVIDLNEAIAGVVTMLTRLIGENVDLVWKPGDALAPVRIDPSQVGQILTNLCVNARDAIVGSGRIVVATGHASFDDAFCARHPSYLPGEYVQLAVTDSGVGMDSETLSRVFEPFFTTKELGRGTGLGLATVYGIVKQNGGFASASSEPGVGTTFSVYLPRVHGAPDASPVASAREAKGHGDATILLVEDEPAILTLTTRSLKGQGYVVLAAGTPREALRIAAEHRGAIDLLLTDVIMPDMDGRALADALRSTRANLKVLFMSGYTSDIITGHDTPEGEAHFIAKPFHLRDLTAKMRQILDTSSPSDAA